MVVELHLGERILARKKWERDENAENVLRLGIYSWGPIWITWKIQGLRCNSGSRVSLHIWIECVGDPWDPIRVGSNGWLGSSPVQGRFNSISYFFPDRFRLLWTGSHQLEHGSSLCCSILDFSINFKFKFWFLYEHLSNSNPIKVGYLGPILNYNSNMLIKLQWQSNY